jgi:hypothetical protein
MWGTHRSPIKRGGGGGALNDVIKLKIINRMLSSGEKVPRVMKMRDCGR